MFVVLQVLQSKWAWAVVAGAWAVAAGVRRVGVWGADGDGHAGGLLVWARADFGLYSINRGYIVHFIHQSKILSFYLSIHSLLSHVALLFL